MSSGIIQHFEVVYETAWKLLKQYLQDIHGIEAASPKAVFRACFSAGIFSEMITNEFIKLSDDRNTTSHIYDQQLARAITQDILKHYEAFGRILDIVRASENQN